MKTTFYMNQFFQFIDQNPGFCIFGLMMFILFVIILLAINWQRKDDIIYKSINEKWNKRIENL